MLQHPQGGCEVQPMVKKIQNNQMPNLYHNVSRNYWKCQNCTNVLVTVIVIMAVLIANSGKKTLRRNVIKSAVIRDRLGQNKYTFKVIRD